MSFVSNMIEECGQETVDAERYRKLRAWMSAGVQESWDEVSRLASVGMYLSWDDFDSELDRLPVCNVGLCEVSNERS